MNDRMFVWKYALNNIVYKITQFPFFKAIWNVHLFWNLSKGNLSLADAVYEETNEKTVWGNFLDADKNSLEKNTHCNAD